MTDQLRERIARTIYAATSPAGHDQFDKATGTDALHVARSNTAASAVIADLGLMVETVKEIPADAHEVCLYGPFVDPDTGELARNWPTRTRVVGKWEDA